MSEKKVWSRNETLQLIEKFEESRGLWDPALGRNSVYIKKYKKNTLLKLAEEFDTTDVEVWRKLHNLKTQFAQELKKQLQQSSSGEVYKSKWQYFEVLKFLQPTVSISNSRNSSTTSDNSVNSNNGQIEEIEEQLINNTPTVKRNKTSSFKKEQNGHHIRHTEEKPSSKDEYQIFGDYVANEIRNMHFFKYKGLLKRKIQKLIIEYTELDDNERLKQDDVLRENGELLFQSKPGTSHVKDETESTEPMYLVINGVRHFLDSPQRQDDPLGKTC